MEPFKEGDLVRVAGDPAGPVLKVAQVQYVRHGEYCQRTGRERMPVASCLLPPYDDPNRFVNHCADDLEKVQDEKPKAKK